jgi:ligand-binding SRPBCC domain-containing protein
VTWRAKHFGIYQKLTSKITEFDQPNYFADVMISGALREFKHGHYFAESDSWKKILTEGSIQKTV